MPKTKIGRRSHQAHSPRPIQDVVVSNKQSRDFPTVGMTLSSYQKNSAAPASKINLQTKPSRWSRIRRRMTLKRTVLSLLLIVILGGGYFVGRDLYDLHKAFGGSIFDLFHSATLRGEDSGRVNILLAGEAGQNSGQSGGPELTDSIMVVSLDTKKNTGWMLSVPRDLYVSIPRNGYGKINAVNEDVGMTGLESVVSQKLGIPIDYYALIDYDAFKQAVDAVGGIRVDIQSGDPRGLYDAYTHLKLPNGWVSLDGQQALDLARARGDDVAGDVSYGFPESDFDRTLHQRQMLVALKSKATSAGVLANPLKLSGLFDALGDNVKTDLNLSDVRTLYNLSNKIPNSKIQSLSLNSANGQDLLENYFDPEGQEDLIPAAGINNYSDIQAFVAQHSSDNPIVQEDAKVVVLNGTDTAGLAAHFQQQLKSDSVNVDQIGDAYANINQTQIIDASSGKMPATRAELVKVFGNNVTSTNPYAGVYSADFIVIVGANLATE